MAYKCSTMLHLSTVPSKIIKSIFVKDRIKKERFITKHIGFWRNTILNNDDVCSELFYG